ncbi:Esterase-like activity of phytase [Amphritea atlantica]|uniref:Esterase-like activity of phytase n=1 Tax=Amphritea atlantica TaxID=355243 RepID=A0A1H9LVC3_9GAMM|nr:esterase-like activity of phytase family protein [Amphritea atlantica]SER15374.1 Esterase-like activity of phytase [Amphritea atlantica]
MPARCFTKTLLAISIAAIATTSQANSFNRISSFGAIHNLPEGTPQSQETSPEIIAASEDGNTLVYSDSPFGTLGFVDITDAAKPVAGGSFKLDGEPTSVAISGQTVFAAVNTSESYTKPSGYLLALGLQAREEQARCDLGGQPDSVAVSKDGRYVAVAIENERDEDLNDGALPQFPAGWVSIIPVKKGLPECDKLTKVDMTGLAEIGAIDPEPEFLDFNSHNEIVVTLQENNHLVVIDAASGKILNHFTAGSVELQGIDIEKDKKLDFSGTQTRLREPDSVKWLDDNRFVIANEGDMNGGARGFTIFHKDGRVLFESGSSFEQQVVLAGHYPEKRSGKKGSEPEGVAIGKFGDETYIFILSERASVIGVYRDTGAAPEFVQLLPSGIAPESAVVIPQRNLLVSANEKDLIEDKGPRAHVMLYRFADEPVAYPQIISTRTSNGLPIGWGALSGLTADSTKPGILYAVNDSFYANQPSIFSIDANQTPAKITAAMPVLRDGKTAKKLDLEGIAVDGDGGFWLASEGKTSKGVPHAIHHANSQGEIDRTIDFPAELLKHEVKFGAEGITMIGDTLWIAIQRPWKDDPADQVKLLAYNLKTNSWGAVRYPLEHVSSGWVGLSEIVSYGDKVYIIERDNQLGESAAVKRLYSVSLDQLKPAAIGSELPVVNKTLVHDFLPDLKSLNGYVQDKIEGFTIDAAGKGFAVTDNDGVDDSSGETLFFSLGKM